MRLFTIFAGIGTLACAVPSAAQYYSYGYPHPNGYGGYTQIAVNRCTDAVQQRLDGNRYAYRGGYGAPRVLGVSRVVPHGYSGAVTVQGVASSGGSAGYAYGSRTPVDMTWQCSTDYRGVIVGISVQPARGGYGYNPGYPPAQNSPYDYSQYGYRRY